MRVNGKVHPTSNATAAYHRPFATIGAASCPKLRSRYTTLAAKANKKMEVSPKKKREHARHSPNRQTLASRVRPASRQGPLATTAEHGKLYDDNWAPGKGLSVAELAWLTRKMRTASCSQMPTCGDLICKLSRIEHGARGLSGIRRRDGKR